MHMRTTLASPMPCRRFKHNQPRPARRAPDPRAVDYFLTVGSRPVKGSLDLWSFLDVAACVLPILEPMATAVKRPNAVRMVEGFRHLDLQQTASGFILSVPSSFVPLAHFRRLVDTLAPLVPIPEVSTTSHFADSVWNRAFHWMLHSQVGYELEVAGLMEGGGGRFADYLAFMSA